jgi:IclR family transcriptional regulator, acetate operon repressor
VAGVQSVERAFAVLRCLAAGPAGVTDIAAETGLAKSTVSRLLSTLHDLGAVSQIDAGGAYRTGDLMVELASAAIPGKGLVSRARPHLVALVHAVHEAAGLSVLDGDLVFYLDQVDTDNPVQVRDWTGVRVPAHAVSSGLVMLAAVTSARLDDYLSRPLEVFTPHTMTHPAALRERLARVAAQGWSWVFEEFALGINSVAAPVRDRSGAVVAAVHAHGPSYRFPGAVTEEVAAAEVVATAAAISAAIQ